MAQSGIINEDSPLTIEGSFTKDLIFSKFWLCRELGKLIKKRELNTLVILGSWYGNMALILKQDGFVFERMFLVDKDPGCNSIARRMLGNDDRVVVMTSDANRISYPSRMLPTLVINTSCNDMGHGSWYDRIPTGTMVALQSRSDHEDFSRFDRSYPMTDVGYLGSREHHDPREAYLRHMKIGVK